MGVTHGMLPWENFDLRCSEMLCSGHVFACGKTTPANLIWRPYFNVAVMLQSIVIVLSFCGLLTSCSLWQLKPKKGSLQKQLSVNTLHSHLLEKSSFWWVKWSSSWSALTAITFLDSHDRCYRLRTLGHPLKFLTPTITAKLEWLHIYAEYWRVYKTHISSRPEVLVWQKFEPAGSCLADQNSSSQQHNLTQQLSSSITSHLYCILWVSVQPHALHKHVSIPFILTISVKWREIAACIIYDRAV